MGVLLCRYQTARGTRVAALRLAAIRHNLAEDWITRKIRGRLSVKSVWCGCGCGCGYEYRLPWVLGYRDPNAARSHYSVSTKTRAEASIVILLSYNGLIMLRRGSKRKFVSRTIFPNDCKDQKPKNTVHETTEIHHFPDEIFEIKYLKKNKDFLQIQLRLTYCINIHKIIIQRISKIQWQLAVLESQYNSNFLFSR